MLKPLIAATAIFALAGSSYVYAQQGSGAGNPGNDGGPRAEHHHHHQHSAADVKAFADARIAALKAGLELTPDQARNWPAFESALDNMVQSRIDRMQARQANKQQANSPQAGNPQTQTQTPATPFDRMARRGEAMSKRGAALKQLADAGAPLYQSLTDAQKVRFKELGRVLRPHQHHRADNGGNVRGWREGRGEAHGQGHDGRGRDHQRFGQDGHGWRHDGGRFGQQGGRDGHRQFGQEGRGHGGQRFGQEGHGRRHDGQPGQDGRGWGHGRQFGQNDRGPHGFRHNMSNDGDQGSEL